MSQHDMTINNQGFPAFRADLNNALQALASQSSGTDEPTTAFPYQTWYDTTNHLLKMRNRDNDAWIVIARFDQDAGTWTLVTDSIQLTGGTGTQATLSWNADEETVDLIQNGATLQLGQELQWHCRNNTGSTIADGTVVMATGTIGASGRITIAPYDASNPDNAEYLIGITTEEIANGDDGKITHFGKIRGIDTSAWADGNILYPDPSSAGSLTNVAPTTGIQQPIAFVISSHASNGTIAVRINTFDHNAVSSTGAGLLSKSTDLSARAFELSGSTLQTAQAITVDGTNYAASVAITLPTLTSHTDYLIYHTASGLSAQPWDNAAPADSVMVGGFHAYHTGATINHNSIWDLTYRPSCSPRAMTQCPTGEWVDIYLMDVDYGINGYSRGGVTIADGSSPPKIPAIYGGNGTTNYGSLTWFEAVDLAAAAGKKLLTYASFTAAAYGVVEQQSVGTDPGTTKYQAGYRSACGLEQVTGCMWQWGEDINGSGTGWNAITDGRGSVYGASVAVLLGADWSNGSSAGSRASSWTNAPGNSGYHISSRASCAHMNL